eukprot:2502125-Amphidinium_carterae.1
MPVRTGGGACFAGTLRPNGTCDWRDDSSKIEAMAGLVAPAMPTPTPGDPTGSAGSTKLGDIDSICECPTAATGVGVLAAMAPAPCSVESSPSSELGGEPSPSSAKVAS